MVATNNHRLVAAVCVFCVLLCLFGDVKSQSQSLPYDFSQPCWFNISSEINSTYSLEEIDFIEALLEQQVRLPLSTPPPNGDFSSLANELVINASSILLFEEPGVYTLGDLLYVFDTLFLDSYVLDLLSELEGFTLAVPAYNYMLRTCLDEADTPNYEFLVNSIIGHTYMQFLEEETKPDNPEKALNAVAVGLIYVWNMLSWVELDIQQTAAVVVGGINDAIQSEEQDDLGLNLDLAQEVILRNVVSILLDPFGDLAGVEEEVGLQAGEEAVLILIEKEFADD
eukprot:TRINITY_DN3034_c0_g1_i13.p1 TRINITY_DN3034_c0_g1~~TRINITY_DN3034_c0_g1_i13.p1  ORF type:complete len:283 (-),score=47.08 TRINITY_DN3034_c0_g1_i13:2763-3611(-)